LYDIISGQQLENNLTNEKYPDTYIKCIRILTKIFQEAKRKWNRELKEQQD